MSSPPPSDPARPPPQPLLNPKYRHISRSAAKRESVQLLGSIKDLQRHFLRAASIEHRPGAGVGVKGLDTLGEEEENRDPLHQPMATISNGGPSKERRPWKEVELVRVDIETARKEVKEIIGDLRRMWGIQGSPGSSSTTSPTDPAFPQTDTQQLLIRTARSIRRVRELSLSITQSNRKVSSGMSTMTRSKQGRPSISTPSRPAMQLPRAVSGSDPNLPTRRSSLGVNNEGPSDPFAALRKAAMEVLAGLRGLEERLHVETSSHNSSRLLEPEPRLSDGSGATSPISDELSRPSSSMSGLTSEPESMNELEEEEWNMNILAADGDLQRQVETWEERIAAQDRQYRVVEQSDTSKERESVRRWLGIAESLFRPEGEGVIRGEWAEGDWQGRSPERIHAFLTVHLAFDLRLYLPNSQRPDFRQSLLSRLSDGYILIQALNTALHASPRSWGFIPDEDVHDTLNAAPPIPSSGSTTPEGLDERGTEGWTFRRIGNLTAWAAALRQRYNILLNLPTPKSASAFLVPPAPRPSGRPENGLGSLRHLPSLPSAPPSRRIGEIPPYNFDPAKVAKREDDWEAVLEGLILRWIDEVVLELDGSGTVRDRERGGMI